MISRVIYINTDFTHREERKRLETSKNVLNRKDEKQATTPAVFNSKCLLRGTHTYTHTHTHRSQRYFLWRHINLAINTMYIIYIHEVAVNKHLMCFLKDLNINFQRRQGTNKKQYQQNKCLGLVMVILSIFDNRQFICSKKHS